MSESSKFAGFDTVQDYTKAALQATLACAKASNQIDCGLFDYYNSFKGFRKSITEEREKILSLISSLIPSQMGQEDFKDLDEEEQMDFLKEVNSSILENVSYLLDESDGHKKPAIELVVSTARNPINTSWNRKNTMQNKEKNIALLSAKNIERPQYTFKEKVDNSNTIFVPTIKEKPNALKPLAILLEKDEAGLEEFSHPYEFELERFVPPPQHLEQCKPITPKPVEETKMVYINTVDGLNDLLIDLKKQKEFAIDLEAHTYRSYQGFCCLLQISTRDQDYIVDTLLLRSELWILNEVFTNPKIVKVFHGADMDIIWLQRDFGVYVVNMFDTGQAARVLSFPHLSLAYLTRYYCKVELNKQYQLADWRIRPLPEELLKYAREDTHYLLYIYDCMKKELLKRGNELKNLLISVFERSTTICLKRYRKPAFTEDKYLDLHMKSKKNFNPRQLFCFKHLYEWRDRMARAEDESCGYVLPNHMLYQICENLPRDQQGIIACCNPLPPLVQQHLNDLLAIITKTMNYSFALIEERQKDINLTDTYKASSFDLHNILHCPHDIHAYDDTRMHLQEFPDGADGPQSLKVPYKCKPALYGCRPVRIQAGECVSKEAAKKVENDILNDRPMYYEKYLMTIEVEKRLKETQNAECQEEEEEKDTKAFITPLPVKERAPISNSMAKQSRSRDDHPVVSDGEEETLKHESPETVFRKTKPKLKKKKQKRNRAHQESQSDNSNSGPPRKKSKTPSTSPSKGSSAFQPFDYSKTSYSSVANNQDSSSQSTSHFKPETVRFKKSGKVHQKRNKQARQASFKPGRNQTNRRHWPTE